MIILVTGVAGFIGFHVARQLLAIGHRVIGVDNLNDYYEVRLKRARLNLLVGPQFRFLKADIADFDTLMDTVAQSGVDTVIHLAAQAGVRYSIENPKAYFASNLVGFGNVLEFCRQTQVRHLIYASSSSVYGANSLMPFSVDHRVDHPVSLYAATKKANELMAHSYSHLYSLPSTGLRFFTVYGPWGRPDMAYFSFTKAILQGQPIRMFNHGDMLRDFTYIDDVTRSIEVLLDRVPAAGSISEASGATSTAPYRLLNVGNQNPVRLETFVETLEQALGVKANKIYEPMQAGDVPATYADVSDFSALTGFAPDTPLATGLNEFVSWYRDYYRI